MALNDVEHCEACQIHEDVVKAVTDHMPDEDQLLKQVIWQRYLRYLEILPG